jgi:hypothetical protein
MPGSVHFISKQQSKYVSLRSLVHLVGTELEQQTRGIVPQQQPGDNSSAAKTISSRSSFRVEKPGEIAVEEDEQRVGGNGAGLVDLYTSQLNGRPLARFPARLLGRCLLCSKATNGSQPLFSHVTGKIHGRALKRAPCTACEAFHRPQQAEPDDSVTDSGRPRSVVWT